MSKVKILQFFASQSLPKNFALEKFAAVTLQQ